MGKGREQLHVLNTKIYSDMTNADLPVFFLFRQGAFNHTEFKKNFQNSEPSDTKSKATERPPERKNKLVNSSRAKYNFCTFNEAYMQIYSEYPERHTVLSFSFNL